MKREFSIYGTAILFIILSIVLVYFVFFYNATSDKKTNKQPPEPPKPPKSDLNIIQTLNNVKLAAGCTGKEAKGRNCNGWCKRNTDNGNMECNYKNGQSHFWKIQKIKKSNGSDGIKIYNSGYHRWCNWKDVNGWTINCNEIDENKASVFTLRDSDNNAFTKIDINKQNPGDFALLDTGDSGCKTSKNGYQKGAHNISRGPHDKKKIKKQCEGTNGQTPGWNTWVTDIQ